MKIFAVIHAYGSETPDMPQAGEEPLWYLMPESAISRTPNPFFVPDFDTDFVAHPSLCLRIGRLGKGIAPRFAHRYIDGWTMGAAVTATNTLRRLREIGLPWTSAVSFDRSCLLGNLQPIDTLINYGAFVARSGEACVKYDTDCIKPGIGEIISTLSRYNTIKTGDLVMVALKPEGIKLIPDTRLKVYAADDDLELIDINIK